MTECNNQLTQLIVSPCTEALSAAHSRLAVLQVREVRLSRALEAATAAETLARRDKDELELDMTEMSRAAQERLAFHESRAAEAELRGARHGLK